MFDDPGSLPWAWPRPPSWPRSCSAPSAAWAHVVVQPPSLPKGASDAIFSFSTPNETTNGSNVTGLEVDFPTNTPVVVGACADEGGLGRNRGHREAPEARDD